MLVPLKRRLKNKYEQTYHIHRDEIYHATVLQLLALYKEELIDYFNIMISKVINGKRKSNKVIKSLDNMDTFAQSDYEYNSLHIIIKKIVVFLKGYLSSQNPALHFIISTCLTQFVDSTIHRLKKDFYTRDPGPMSRHFMCRDLDFPTSNRVKILASMLQIV